jgi:hypothetical protein
LGKEGTRETAKALEELLWRFGKTRNKIAHSGSSGILVTDSEREEFLTFFRALASALVHVVAADLAKRN